ncbi:MAG: M20/M25/M40 family metallo-hydrolase, partial [Bacteroidales bacterium]|nr:M20/M25/M40 family metallo-hydrolase [Bacteroidales bacterium]
VTQSDAMQTGGRQAPITVGEARQIAEQQAAITQDELTHIAVRLTSDEFSGRGTGTAGDSLAAIFIREEFMKAGLAPFNGSGLQQYRVNTAVESGDRNKLLINGSKYLPDTYFAPLALTSNSVLSAPVVFCGYGFTSPADSLEWNDFSGIDIKGKWVLMLRGYPESNPAAKPYEEISSDRMKVMNARENGAAGVLLVSGEKWDPADNLEKPSRGEGSAGIPVLHIKRGVADSILKPSGHTLGELEERADAMTATGSFITRSVADAETEVIARQANTANVVMKLGDTQPGSEYVIIGAHYDHLGMGGPGSGSRTPDTVAIHYGADDNASGVALMIELAERLAAEKQKYARGILFVAFSGEEMGLLGSKYFVENMGIDPATVNLMVNLDMVGRLKEGNGLQIGGVGTATGLRDKVASFNDTSELSLSFTEEGYGPSDHSSFYAKDIPVLVFTTGAHLDYHTPFDTWDKLNYDGMVTIGDLLYDIVNDAAGESGRLAFTEAGPKNPSQSMSRRRGVTFGIMPDFAGNVKNGLRADFVTPGKPAALGGMEKGDIIVAIEDKPVNNIEDYMYRLSQLKPGQTVTVEVIRGEKRELLIIQL